MTFGCKSSKGMDLEELWTLNIAQETPICVFTAANLGLLNLLQAIIQRNNNKVNKKNEERWTPLMYAAFAGRHNVCEFLLRNGAKCQLQNNKGKTALMLASIAGHKSVVELLLKYKSCDVNQMDKRGWTALFYATQNHFDDIVSMLISREAAINIQEKEFGCTPLMIALKEQHFSTADLLRAYGADLNIKSFSGESAHAFYVMYRHSRQTRDFSQTHNNESSDSSTNASESNSNSSSNNTNDFLDLKHLLTENGLEKFYELFEEQEIDMSVFLTLTEEDLFEIGISNLGPRKRIFNLICQTRKS